MTKISCTTLALCAVQLTSTARADGSPLLETLGGFGDAGGRQARVFADGPSAAYFNPALLVAAPAGLTLGAAALGLRLGVALHARGDGRYDVPAGLENATHADGSRFDHYPLATETLQLGREASPSQSATSPRPRQAAGSGAQTQSYTAFGVAAHALEGRLAIGVHGLIPNGNFTELRSFYVDEREQFTTNSLHPELYGDRLSAPSFALGLAWRADERLWLGIGTGVSLRANALAPAYVADAGQLASLVLNVNAKVRAALAPQAGLMWRPHDRWRITGTLHAPRALDVRADVRYLLSTGVEQASRLRLLHDWMPWQAGAGVAWHVLQRDAAVLTLATSAVYGRWSGYLDRHAERPARELGWQDTLTTALGARLTAGAWSLGVDVEYQPTPVPPQRGRSNYVDNDRIGASHTLGYAIAVGGSQLELGAQLQGFWLVPRTARKLMPPTFPDGVNRSPALVTDELPDDAQLGLNPAPGAVGLQTNNPGWPGFSSHGWLASAGLYIRVTP